MELAEGRAIENLDLRLTRGAVITGRVLDEDGEALVRAIVAVERYQYVRGERQLVAAGGGVTDDRGQYRVFGLAPGDYYVSASTPGGPQGPGRGMQTFAMAGDGRGGRGFFGGAPDEPDPVGYAPTYYPGVINASDAGKVTVGPGQELEGIDFQAQLVTLATVRGFVVGADGPVSVLLAPQASGGVRRGQILRGGSQGDGSFSISSVPPGRYTAVARSGGRGGAEKMGTQNVNVTGDNVTGLTIALQPGVSISGYITVESAGTPAPDDYSTFRVDAPDVSPLPFGGGPGGGANASGARAEKNGRFQIDNVFPGEHDLRVSGQGAWTLKSVSIGGRDVTDQPIEIRAGQNLDAITIVLTDRTTEITGTVRDGSGSPVADGTVIAFSSDQQYLAAAIAPDPGGAHGSERRVPAAQSPPGRLQPCRRRHRRAGPVVRSVVSRADRRGRDPHLDRRRGKENAGSQVSRPFLIVNQMSRPRTATAARNAIANR